jgi:hypothetical protein
MDVLDQMKLQATQRVAQHADEMRRESQFEGAFVHACMAVINNRRLSSSESNRAMLESLLNPGEEPSAKTLQSLSGAVPDQVHMGRSTNTIDSARATQSIRRFHS